MPHSSDGSPPYGLLGWACTPRCGRTPALCRPAFTEGPEKVVAQKAAQLWPVCLVTFRLPPSTPAPHPHSPGSSGVSPPLSSANGCSCGWRTGQFAPWQLPILAGIRMLKRLLCAGNGTYGGRKGIRASTQHKCLGSVHRADSMAPSLALTQSSRGCARQRPRQFRSRTSQTGSGPIAHGPQHYCTALTPQLPYTFQQVGGDK